MSEQERPYRMSRGSTSTYPTTPPKPDYPPNYPPQQYPKEPEPAPYYPPGYAYDNMDLPKGDITGYFQAYTIDYDRDPNRVLERARPWYIVCEWAVIGTAVAAFGGTWHLTGAAEAIGPNLKNSVDDVTLFEDTLPVDAAEPGKKREYRLEVTIPANVIPQDGAYKVVVFLTHSITGRSGKEHVTRLAGFVEIPMLQFYSYED